MNLVYVKFYGFFPALIAELLESDLALKLVLGEDSSHTQFCLLYSFHPFFHSSFLYLLTFVLHQFELMYVIFLFYKRTT